MAHQYMDAPATVTGYFHTLEDSPNVMLGLENESFNRAGRRGDDATEGGAGILLLIPTVARQRHGRYKNV